MSEESAKKPTGWMIFLGILVIVAGFLAIFSPFIAGISITIFIGALLIVVGVAQLIHAFSLKFKQGLIATILLGLLSIAAGIFIMAEPLEALLGLTIVLGIFFIADGIGWIVMAFNHKPEKGWGWTLFSGIISILLGILILAQWPLSGVWAIGVLFGVRMLTAGFGMAFFGSAIRSIRKPS